MRASPLRLLRLFSVVVICAVPTLSSAADLYLADGRAFPGQLWLSTEGSPERLMHRREGEANPAFPRAAMKLGQVAIGVDGKIYFCSGLDGYVLHLQDGRHEILNFEFEGQVRDLACTGDGHTVYFSVVPTPRDGEALADGKIYRRDLWLGRPTEVATIRQSEVGGNWWGTFTVRDGIIYLATFEDQSRLFKVTSSGPDPIFPGNRFKIHGICAADDSGFYFADGSNKVYRTADFQRAIPVAQGEREFTDVAIRSFAESRGP